MPPLKGNIAAWASGQQWVGVQSKLKNLYYKSIGGMTEGSATLFTMHNSARKLIGDHIAFLNAKVHSITSQIALLHEHKMMGCIMVDEVW
jgi:hypothetical protein